MERVLAGGPPLIITADQDLLDGLLRLCAAAAVTPQVISDAAKARAGWWQASAIVVGEDRADDIARLGLSRRDGVALVSNRLESPRLWQQGIAVRADHVVVLPADQSWLIEWLSNAVDGGDRQATTVSLIGARGGAGASTFAAALALTAAKRRMRALLIDADPLAGGIELVLGCEQDQGLRWPEVAATQGRVSASAFRSALPEIDGLAVLSWDLGDQLHTDPDTMRSMLSAGQRGAELVVVDLPRRLDDAASEALLGSDVLLMVITCDVRAVAGANRMLAMLRTRCADIRLVARRLSSSDLSSEAIGSTVRLPVAGCVPSRRAVERAVNEGLGPLGRSGLERACGAVLDDVIGPIGSP
ncbi:MAG: septum site-determining protein Ssd [Nocardioidaceae bacterium]